MTLFDDVNDEASKEDLRQALIRTQRQLAKAKATRQEMAEVTVQAVQDAILAHWKPQPIRAPRVDRGKHDEHALLHVTDWQGSKITPTYNSVVMCERVKRLHDKVDQLIGIYRQAKNVPDITLLITGDMLEGLFNYPTQPFEVDATLHEQMVLVATLLVDTVRRLLANFRHVHVIAEWGNHGRIGSKRAVVPKNDNMDRMTYTIARGIMMGTPDAERVTWEDCPEDVQRIVIGNYRAIAFHGDEVGRNGYASPMTIVNHVAKWQSGALVFTGEPFSFTDAYFGHYHTHNEWALPNGQGSCYQTGSTESDNRYAGIGMASVAVPSQRLHIIDPKRGRVVNAYKIWLDQ